MPHQLTFITRESYDSSQDGITIEAVLRLGEESFVCKAKVDPGAQVCLFKREIGEELGLDIESAIPASLIHWPGLCFLTATRSRCIRWGWSSIR
jgi:hypothetical protein